MRLTFNLPHKKENHIQHSLVKGESHSTFPRKWKSDKCWHMERNKCLLLPRENSVEYYGVDLRKCGQKN